MADQRLREDWLALEKYRLQVVEDWPEGPKKETSRRAILSQIGSLQRPPNGNASLRAGMLEVVLPVARPRANPFSD